CHYPGRQDLPGLPAQDQPGGGQRVAAIHQGSWRGSVALLARGKREDPGDTGTDRGQIAHRDRARNGGWHREGRTGGAMSKPTLRSRRWFDNPADPGMTAMYVERYMNYGITRAELQSGKPIIGI